MSPRTSQQIDQLRHGLLDHFARLLDQQRSISLLGAGITRLRKLEMVVPQSRHRDASFRQKADWIRDSLTLRARQDRYSCLALCKPIRRSKAASRILLEITIEHESRLARRYRYEFREKRPRNFSPALLECDTVPNRIFLPHTA